MKRILFIVAIPLAIIVVLLLASEKDDHGTDAKVMVKDEPLDPTDPSSDQEEETSATQSIYVDIKGEVKHPGVYEMESEARVVDAIETAGGFTTNADQSQVNLALKVQDEMVIDVIAVGENGSSVVNEQSNGTVKVKINQATAEEIEALNGIGPAKAAAIVQYREEHGLFQKPEDLLNVSGIGEKTLEALEDEIQVP
ncbi:helix-hairpin-helix domain-containing protein [Clostridium sp. 1xD42-85]|nr:helix-hairpin-helix domain-containing protein [Clostridium sp. 1xD42-85]NBJ68584.1 ComEA family DNA-binding protein [Roseburia sp. 1XD42-34]RKI80805.1 ComEA family DNA-binding protein [Clostridium sp. 1xD42-85]